MTGGLAGFEQGGLILGERLRRQLAVGGEDYVTLLLPKGGGDRPVEPVTTDFDLAGSFSIGMAEIDGSYVFMPLDQAQRFFELDPGQVTAIDVLTTDPNRAPAIAAQIRQALGDGYKVSDWRQRNAAFVGALEVERTVMFFILTLIVLVAALTCAPWELNAVAFCVSSSWRVDSSGWLEPRSAPPLACCWRSTPR
jgi:lipoprotein-releasing system permease protein